MAELKQFQVTGSVRPDRTWQMNTIIAELQDGRFENPALMVDELQRDPRISAVLHTRCSAVASLELELTPADDSKLAKTISEDLEQNFDRIVPDWFLIEMVRWAQCLGPGVGLITDWKTDSEGTWPTLEVFHPQHIYWDWAEMVYRAYHYGGETNSVIVPGDGTWFLYTPLGYQYGWRRGLVISLGDLYLMRRWDMRDWARANEVYGAPIRKGIVPETAPAALKEQFLRAIRSLGNEANVIVPQGVESKFDIELLEAGSDMHKSFMEFKQSLDTDIAITVLGQNLTTEVKGGSRAAAQVHESVRMDRVGSDAETLAHAVREQILRQWVQKNYNRPELTPRIKWRFEPPEDLQSKAMTLKTLAEALNGFALVGAQVDTRRIIEEFNIPMKESKTETGDSAAAPPSEDKAALTSAPSFELTPTDIATIVTVNEARASVGLAPLVGSEGELTLAEFKARNAGDLAKVAAAEAGETKPVDPEDDKEKPPGFIPPKPAPEEPAPPSEDDEPTKP